MSTRWYPLYQRGNPQLRVFLPNFWMKLVKSEHALPKNIVEFHCSMEMTRIDIKNYLEKIYKVPVIKVNTRIALGKFRRNELNNIIKDDDIKVAYVHLPRYETFEFPNIFKTEERLKEQEKDKKTLDDAKSLHRERVEKSNKIKPGLPTWYSL